MNEQQNDAGNKASKNKTVVIVLVIGAVLAFMIFYAGKKEQEQQAAMEQQKQQSVEKLKGEVENKKAAVEQSIGEAQSELKKKEQEIAEEAVSIEMKNCLTALENAKTQKALLEKEITGIEALGKAIKNDPDTAIEVCRYINSELSKNECAIKIENKAIETQGSVEKMTGKIVELDAIITAGC